MRLIDADAFVNYLKTATEKCRYEETTIDKYLTVKDVIDAMIAELNGTTKEGFKNAPTIDCKIDVEHITKADVEKIAYVLKKFGYEVKAIKKSEFLKAQAEKLGLDDCNIENTVKKSILDIADWATNNFEEKNGRRIPTISSEIEEEYGEICTEILKIIQRYYGKQNKDVN